MTFFLQGMAMGFAIAAPVGPIGLLCIQRTFSYGIFSGLATGVGAAFVDAIFGLIAAVGLTTIIAMLQTHKAVIQIVGGILLFLMAYKILSRLPAAEALKIAKLDHRHNPAELFGDFFSTVMLMITNPMAILLFLAIFSGLNIGAGSEESQRAVFYLVAGVFTGSMLWWGFLTALLSFFREKMSSKMLRWANIVSGASIAGFGIAIVLQAVLILLKGR